MAREKSSTIITEAGIFEEEQSATPTAKVVSPPGKKKVLGKRSGDIVGGGGGGANGYVPSSNRSSQKLNPVVNNGKVGSTSGRGNKTLAWFLNDVLFENPKKSNVGSLSSSPTDKGDVASKVVSDRLMANKPALHIEGKKRGKRSRQRQLKKPPENKVAVQVQVVDDAVGGKVTPKIDFNKEDYWYYDPASNGYYYEQLGSRGWRRHSPAAEQKRIQMEQEMMKFWREAGGIAMPAVDAYSTVVVGNGYFAAPQVKYDAESDGFYFEMPSVDGWKKRQPNSNSSSSISSNGSIPKGVSAFQHASFTQIEEGHPISYGAALARGQLPPAFTVAPNLTYLPEPFSSDTSSMTTLSEGAPTPPPRNHYGMNGIAEQDCIDAVLAEHYDNAMKLDDPLSLTVVGSEVCDDPSLAANQIESTQLVSSSTRIKQATSYADVAAASCNVKKKDDSSSKNLSIPRPENLQLQGISNKVVLNKDENVNEHDLLLNFNADKFISDLLSCCPNPQRFMRDLAALKTPVAAPSRMLSLESPLSSNEGFDCRSLWSAADDSRKCSFVENAWSTNDLENERFNFSSDMWTLGSDLDCQPPEKSKLSIWCNNNNLLSGALIDK